MSLRITSHNEIFDRYLTDAEIEKIENLQYRLFEDMYEEKEKERKVTYMGKEIIVKPRVFPPRSDSIVLAQSLNFQQIPNPRILDVGTGSGVLSVIAAHRLGWTKSKRKKGSIVGTDISQDSVDNARQNIEDTFFSQDEKKKCNKSIVDFIKTKKLEEVFPSVDKDNKFDIVIANLPFRNKKIESSIDEDHKLIRYTMWDEDFIAHKVLLEKGKKYLKENGFLLLTMPNYADEEKLIFEIAELYKWEMELMGVRHWNPFGPGRESDHSLISVACVLFKPK